MTTRGYEWVLEADIQACFDTIEHTVLMDRIRARIKDKKVLALVKAFLKAGIMTAAGDREDTWTGTPQGGILSPLLANIALSVLDEHFDRQWKTEMATWHHRDRRRRNGLGSWKLVRYADDFVLVVNGQHQHADTLRDQVAQVIAPLGLHLAQDKTRVVHIDEGFDFLGWHIRRMRKRGTAKRYVYTILSRRAVQAIRDRIKWRTSRSTLHQDLDQLPAGYQQVAAGMGELLPSRRVQPRQLHCGLSRLAADRHMDQTQTRTHLLAGGPPPVLRQGLAVRPQRGRFPRRIQRRHRPLSLPRRADTDPLDHHDRDTST